MKAMDQIAHRLEETTYVSHRAFQDSKVFPPILSKIVQENLSQIESSLVMLKVRPVSELSVDELDQFENKLSRIETELTAMLVSLGYNGFLYPGWN